MTTYPSEELALVVLHVAWFHENLTLAVQMP